jgi:hypothetical protein
MNGYLNVAFSLLFVVISNEYIFTLIVKTFNEKHHKIVILCIATSNFAMQHTIF